MSRTTRELRRIAEKRWPNVCEAVSLVWNEDQSVLFENEVAAIRSLATDFTLEWRQQFLREWRECNAEWASQSNFDSLLQDGLNMNRVLQNDVEARKLWNATYDTVIDSVRAEFKPSGKH